MGIISRVPVRPVSRMDLEQYAKHLKALGPEDRYRRFCNNVSDDAIDAEVGKLYQRMSNYSDDVVFGHFDSKGELVGAAQVSIVRCKDGSKTAEIGVSIHPDHRGRGIAKALMNRGILHARNLGCDHVETTCLTTNGEMSSLARSVGMRVTSAEGGERHAEMELDPASVGSITEEHFLTQSGIWDEAFDRSRKTSTDFFEQFCMRMVFPLALPNR